MLDCAVDGAPVVQQWELDRPFANARDRNDSQKYRQVYQTDTWSCSHLAPKAPESMILVVAK